MVLTMIVRNEAAVIRRCLESVRPYIDAWSISDTGSTDGTQDLIREALKGIPGTLIERPWVDFSTNRNEAIEAGLAHAPDFFMTLDADEVFVAKPGFALSLSCDIHNVMFRMDGTEARWPRRMFFRPRLRYRYVLDEVIEDGETQSVLPACEVVSHTDGARSKDGLIAKYNRDVEVLQRAVELEPDEPRYWFYLAQRLMGAHRWDEAIAAYEHRIELPGGFDEERFQSAFMIAQIREEMGDPDRRGIAQQYLKSWLMRPERAEPLFALACVHSQDGEHPLAEIYARAAQRLPRPPAGLPVDEAVYAWRAVDLLAGSLAEQGKLSEALQLLQRIEPLPQLPELERPRIRENMAAVRAALGPEPDFIGPDEATYQNQVERIRDKGLRGFLELGCDYLSSPLQQAHPGPQRWLWILQLRWLGQQPVAILAICGLLAWWVSGSPLALSATVLSPLVHLLSRRMLQDTTVAAVALAAIGSAAHGSPWLLALSVFGLTSVKEAGVLMLPAIAFAWWTSGSEWSGFALAVAAGGLTSVAFALALLRDTWLPCLRAGAKSHRTPYTQDHQEGAPQRLLVDLVLVSPVTTLMGAFGDWKLATMALLILLTHALSPVRNVRTVLAADLLLRASAANTFGLWALATLPFDVLTSRKLREVYDPVTSALTRALGISR